MEGDIIMDAEGNIRVFADEELKEGYHPIKKEHQAQAGMLLHGEKETQGDKELFTVWTGHPSKKDKRRLQRRLDKLNKKLKKNM